MAGPKKKQSFFPADPNTIPAPIYALEPTQEPIKINALTPRQRYYLRSLQKEATPYVVAHGPAGTGKTMLAVLHAINEYRAGNIKKIIVTRPMVGAGGEEIGYLPGDVAAKTAPWAIPVIDIFKENYPIHHVHRLLDTEVIELAPLALMRGRTLKHAAIIVDEAQNMTVEQAKMVISRLGEGSRMFITGDIEQYDDRGLGKSGLVDLLDRIEQRPEFAENFVVHEFAKSDSVRHPAIESALRLYAA